MITFILSEVNEPSDQAFMIRLYEKYKGRIYNTIRKIIFEEDYVEDVAQDVLLNLCRNVGTIKRLQAYQVEVYIAYTTKHTSYNHNQKRKMEKKYLVLDDDDKVIHYLQTEERYLEEEIERLETIDQIKEIIKTLPVNEQDIIIRKYYFRQEDSEIAKAHNLKADSVRMKLTRIRRNIFKRMNEKGLSYEITR